MPRIAALSTTRAVLAAVSPVLLARGFRKTEQDRRSLDTSFAKQLSADVEQVISLTFKDGPIAAKHIIWMTGAMGLASGELLGRYRRLTGSEAEGYCPVSVSFDHCHQEYGEGGWKCELPSVDSAVASFRTVFDEKIDPLLDCSTLQRSRPVFCWRDRIIMRTGIQPSSNRLPFCCSAARLRQHKASESRLGPHQRSFVQRTSALSRGYCVMRSNISVNTDAQRRAFASLPALPAGRRLPLR